MIFIFTMLICVPIVQQSYGYTTSLGKTCLNPDGIRALDFSYTVGVQEFDELNKQVYVIIDFDADDEDKQVEPFQVMHRRYPYLGSQIIHVIENNDKGYFETKANQHIHERRITPIPNSPLSLWPFDTYKIPMFLEFDKDVKLCYDIFDDGSSDISAYKSGNFPENPYWNVKIDAHEITMEQLREIIPDATRKFTDSTLFQFDTTIIHTDNYKAKITAYLFLIFAPLIPMIGHLLWLRFEKLNSHITLFAGVTILILTSITVLVDRAPIDLTLFEILAISSIVVYAIGFSIFLMKRYRNTWSKSVNQSTKS